MRLLNVFEKAIASGHGLESPAEGVWDMVLTVMTVIFAFNGTTRFRFCILK
jgi:hypothetical protein